MLQVVGALHKNDLGKCARCCANLAMAMDLGFTNEAEPLSPEESEFGTHCREVVTQCFSTLGRSLCTTCPICLEEVNAMSEESVILPCLHAVHIACHAKLEVSNS